MNAQPDNADRFLGKPPPLAGSPGWLRPLPLRSFQPAPCGPASRAPGTLRRRALGVAGCLLLASAAGLLPAAHAAGGQALLAGGCSCGGADLRVCVLPFFDPAGDPSSTRDLSPVLKAAVERRAGPLPWIEPRVFETESTVVDPLLFRSPATADRGPDTIPDVYFQLGRERRTRVAVGLGAQYAVRVHVIPAGRQRTLSAEVTRTAGDETVFRAEKDAQGPEAVPDVVRGIGEAVGAFFAEEAAYRCIRELERLVPAQLCTPESAAGRAEEHVKAYPDSLRLKILFLGLLVHVPDGVADDRAEAVAAEILPLLALDDGEGQRLLMERDLDPFLTVARGHAGKGDWPAVLAACRRGLAFWPLHGAEYRLLMVRALAETGGSADAASLCARLRHETRPGDPLADPVAQACAGW